ncbi:MAG: CoA pyrophosphatase [Pseudomonadota bacterium]
MPVSPEFASVTGSVRANLAGFPVRRLDTEARRLRAAAVAVVVVTDPEPAVLLTRRAATLNRHAGQFALPGGRLDPGETVDQAAVREVREELGLSLSDGDRLGQLDDCETRSGFCVSTVVYGCCDAALAPNPAEVAAVYTVLFRELRSDAIPLFEDGTDGEPPVLYSDLPSVGTTVYAPTAAILYQFREVALLGRTTRIDAVGQPRFAWR